MDPLDAKKIVASNLVVAAQIKKLCNIQSDSSQAGAKNIIEEILDEFKQVKMLLD